MKNKENIDLKKFNELLQLYTENLKLDIQLKDTVIQWIDYLDQLKQKQDVTTFALMFNEKENVRLMLLERNIEHTAQLEGIKNIIEDVKTQLND